MANPGRMGKKVQNHPASFIIIQIAAVIGGVVALFMLIDVLRRLLAH